MPRFFIENKDINNNKIIILGDKIKHISKVLRYKEGDLLELCNGENVFFDTTIDEITKDEIKCTIDKTFDGGEYKNLKINLYQGIAKGEKMDTIIQKATELGASSIVPVETKHTVVKLSGDDKVSKKIARWSKISEEAAEQSERGIIPCVLEPMSFINAVKEATLKGKAVICYGREKDYGIKAYLKTNKISDIKELSFFIGPEGGFSKDEIEKAREIGADIIKLGDSILRTETASSMFLSIIAYEMMEG